MHRHSWALKLRKLGIFYRPLVDRGLNHYGCCQILIVLSYLRLTKGCHLHSKRSPKVRLNV
ncbi:hypothetical protein H6G93_16765 [Nostoc sp. FACHB-973]|uniref:Uncharacterized protein n=1 Tax=Desmonostoc muscorum LEGE 12446 TaxID=1828758 RepID=A0A8J7A5D4_DESMC|nr:hypothetical protein [Desmonostoc muscorum]MBD2516637.1 hypothetical protein [Nostoc sp. FACHB-973]MBX9252724.1 hypothetical protein [Desmonostoc muscorum CCALA 125]MCF2146557.1 hypothetical protein [Desmonostoc muscorum LEGE 12446]